MRILQVVHALPSDTYGGTELYAKHLSETLAARGHAVALAAPKGDGSEIDEAVGVYRLPNTVAEGSTADASASVGPARGVVRPRVEAAFEDALTSFEPDLVHFQHFKGLSATLPRCCRRRDIVAVATLHDFWTICHREQLRWGDKALCCGPESVDKCAQCYAAAVGDVSTTGDSGTDNEAVKTGDDTTGDETAETEPYRVAVERRTGHLSEALSTLDRLIAPSRFLRRIFDMYAPEAAELIHLRNGIRTEAFDDAGFDPTSPLRVGYAGRIAESKGLHVLLSAVERARTRLDESDAIDLHVWGRFDPEDDPYHARLRQSDGDGVTIHGRYDAPSTPYRGMDVFVLPSIWYENSPLVIQEAFASRVPVVTGDIGGMAELVTNGTDGLTFAVGDAAALADRLAKLADSPRLVERLRGGIEPPLSLAAHVDDLEALYRTCTTDTAVDADIDAGSTEADAHGDTDTDDGTIDDGTIDDGTINGGGE